jgi:DegV family protein with EDD domain
MTIRIVTDSTCDLPSTVVSEYDIRVIPLFVNFNHQSYLDGIDLSREEFYRKIQSVSKNPTTAIPSPLKFRAVYDSLAEEGATEILSIHISNALSGLLDVVRSAACETTSVPVIVLDSRQLSLGTGFLVETAAKSARMGLSMNEILSRLDEQIKHTHVFAALDTLEYLKRSGRMSNFLSSFGELLQMKPLLKMYDGKPNSERVRTRKNAMKRLIELLYEYGPFEKAAILHSDAAERARELLDEVRNLLPAGEIWFEQINPVLGTHIGPGVIGFACISKG